MDEGQPAVAVAGLVKRYGSKPAVDGIGFEVRRGEVFALLGPNGAGKTTTVEVLEGFRRADVGSVRVLGLDPWTDGGRLKPRLGVMLQEGGLYPAITPREALRLFARFYPRSRDGDTLLRDVGLEEAAEVRYRRLSAGQKQRLGLALALVGRPELVFLDEPTAGLDPQARRATWDLISRLRGEGTTVFLTTHYLEEAEQLADTVAILDAGRLVALGSPQLLMRLDTSIVRLRAASPVPLDALATLPACRGARQDERGIYVLQTDDAPALLADVTALLQRCGILATELRVGGGSLEDVFLELTAAAARP